MKKRKFFIRREKENEEIREEYGLDGYKSYTEKEIFTQAYMVKKLIDQHIKMGKISFDEIKINFSKIKRIYIIGNANDYALALSGAYNFEVLCDTITAAESVFEFNFSNPILDKNTLVIILEKNHDSNDVKSSLARIKTSGAKFIQICSQYGNTENTINLNINEKGDFTSADFIMKYLILSMLSIYIGDKNKVVTDLYKSVAVNSLLSIHQKIDTVLSAKKIIAQASTRINSEELIITGTNVDFAQSIYASDVFSKALKNHVNAIPLDRLKENCTDKNIIALTSCIDSNKAVLQNINPNILILPANINIEHITTISYEETIPLLNPIISCIIIQLLAYSLLNKNDTEKEPLE
ncbi:MAG: SIS domain-containing protein [Acetobacter sp.]|nr:SIS domain-containing protein [Bacteroides sp.]MCM1341144.1 SIS domain-containing protein [Acetobacter sp.]MCM1433522.1 SIS domain-containing protein [Clostridiales bacterium]